MSNLLFKSKKILLLLGDILILEISLYLTLLARNYGELSAESLFNHQTAFFFIFIVWLVVFYISDFYELKSSHNNFTLFSNLVRVFIINGILAVLMFYFLAPLFPYIKPQKVLIIDLLISLSLIFGWRKIFYGLIKSPQISNRTLIIGESDLAKDLIKEIKSRPQLGYQAELLSQIPTDLKNYCIENKIDVLVINKELNYNDQEAPKIFDCLSLGIDIYNLTGFYELITQKIPVTDIDMSWFLENLSENSKKSYEIAKRFLDIIMASIGLILSLPLLPLIAIIIKTESNGQVIFKQIRVGQNGKNFLAMKFRSMISDAEKNGAQWATKNDPRVTRWGKIMRKTRLDEIPQLINVLKGEMSLIGPRPERPEFIDSLSKQIPFYKERLLIKPGLTGWAQLMGPTYGGSEKESLEKMKYDLYYIKNRSLILDLSIILKTIRVVLSRKGQ